MISQTLPPQIPVNRTNPEGGITSILQPADLHAINQRPHQIASLLAMEPSGTTDYYVDRLQGHMAFVKGVSK